MLSLGFKPDRFSESISNEKSEYFFEVFKSMWWASQRCNSCMGNDSSVFVQSIP